MKEAKSKQWCSNCQKIANYYCCWNTAYCDFECQVSKLFGNYHSENEASLISSILLREIMSTPSRNNAIAFIKEIGRSYFLVSFLLFKKVDLSMTWQNTSRTGSEMNKLIILLIMLRYSGCSARVIQNSPLISIINSFIFYPVL